MDLWDWYDQNVASNEDPTGGADPATSAAWATGSPGLGQDTTTAVGGGTVSSSSWDNILKALGLTPATAGLLAGGVGLSALLGGKTPDTGYQGGIPYLTANREMLPVPPSTATPVNTSLPPVAGAGTQLRRPGSGGVTYFSPMTYTRGTSNPGLTPPAAAAAAPTATPPVVPPSVFQENGFAQGGIASLAKGRLLNGPGDGVSDSIPASINGHQPAALADGEYVIPARVVSELGNGSTKAGAAKLDAMMKRIQTARRKATDIAANTRVDKHLPA